MAEFQIHIGCDIGGTFTDIVAQMGDGALHVRKVASTPDDPGEAVVAGLTDLLKDVGASLSDVREVVHGTTVGSNTILQKSGAKTGLITTKGFRDVLEIILHLVKDDIKSIHAVGVPVLSPTEDIANTRISFMNGCVANVTASRISMERTRKIRVFQDDSYVSLDYMNQSGHLHRKTATGIETAEVPIEKRQPLVLELDAFIACVRDQSTPLVSGSHGSKALDLAVEICRQIRESPS